MTSVMRVEQNSSPTTAEGGPSNRLHSVIEKGSRAKWWRRRGSADSGFWYEDANGCRVTDERQLERVRRLAIPPGYTEVRVSPSSRSRLQAIALDSLGRPQYRYNAYFAACQAQKKYAKVEEFGRMLPRLREVTNRHIAEEGLGKERVLAVMLRLINDTYFRLGTEGSVRRYHTFGITSLRNYHLAFLANDHLLFQFTGKHHIKQRRILVDADLAAVMREIKAIESSHLFSYLDADGAAHAITPTDVNRYIKQAMGPQFSAKDFRTWGGTLQAAIALAEIGKAESPHKAKNNIVRATKEVAERLGNTPAVCRSSYIHPVVFERYLQGVTLSDFRPIAQRIIRRHHADFDLEEIELLKLFDTVPACT